MEDCEAWSMILSYPVGLLVNHLLNREPGSGSSAEVCSLCPWIFVESGSPVHAAEQRRTDQHSSGQLAAGNFGLKARWCCLVKCQVNTKQHIVRRSLVVNEVPKKPAKDCPVPKKGAILTYRITLHTWGTIRPGLKARVISAQWCYIQSCAAGLFGATQKANERYLSKRGAQDQSWKTYMYYTKKYIDIYLKNIMHIHK